MSLQVISRYPTELAAILAAAVENARINKAAGQSRKDRDSALVEKVRAFAKQTHDDGVSVEDARQALRLTFASAETPEGKPAIPAGTVKGYGATFAGYRDALANNIPIDEMGVKDAQDRVASDAVKRLNEARKALRESIKGLNADQLAEVTAYARLMKSDAETPAETPETADAEPAQEAVEA